MATALKLSVTSDQVAHTEVVEQHSQSSTIGSQILSASRTVSESASLSSRAQLPVEESPTIPELMRRMTDSSFSREFKTQMINKYGEILAISIGTKYYEAMIPIMRQIVNSFDGSNLEERLEGMKAFKQLRNEMAFALFKEVVRPQVEAMMRIHGDHRSFDEAVCIYGFNRLFVRDIGSAGTDIDFMLVINTDNTELRDAIRNFIKTIVEPQMKTIGVDMESADYLMIDLPSYRAKLGDTRKSNFTLANTGNVAFITGSREILENIFSFTDEQLAEHYGNLLAKNMTIEDLPVLKESILKRIKTEPSFRAHAVDHLRRMANSELYIGKKPYDGKKTIQTVFGNPDLPAKVRARTAPFSIKFCLNRIADYFAASKTQPSSPFLRDGRVKEIENLALLLSNIVCRVDTKGSHPAFILQKAYSDITIDQIAQMNETDRVLVADQLGKLGLRIDPKSETFATDTYDALWQLGDKLHGEVRALEASIFRSALEFATT
jgi:hypothetical protein